MPVVLSARDGDGAATPRRGLSVLIGLGFAFALMAGVIGLLGAGVALADSSCPNEAFRNGPSSHLPDCRAYELVSPADKNGGSVDGGIQFESQPAPQQTAANGESVTYASQTAFTSAGVEVSLTSDQYLARRGPDGWISEGITPPQTYPGGEVDQNQKALDFSLYYGFNEDLTTGFLLSEEPPLSPLAPLDFYNPYLRNFSSGSYELLNATRPPVAKPGPVDAFNEEGFRVEFGGMSSDAEHVAFAANDAIAPKAIAGQENLYEWNAGQLETINVRPDGETTGGATLGGFNESNGKSADDSYPDYYRLISSDGSRVFWTGAERNIYMHEVTPEGPRTVQVGDGKYWGASSDGSVAFFGKSGGQLTPSEHVGGDLYRYDVSTGKTLDIAPGLEMLGMLGISEDGSYVYFAGEGAIAPGAEAGKQNVYLWHSTGPESGTVTLIAVLEGWGVEREDWFAGEKERTSRVSPNGRYLAFDSVANLNGYDSTPLNPEVCEDNGSGELPAYVNYSGKCIEAFEYDATADTLRCVSCNPTGAPPIGDSEVPSGVNFLQANHGWQSNTVQQRYLDDDGRMFFNSKEPLVPQAANHSENVYEFDPEGVGSCALSTGCIYLISAGTGAGASQFVDASEDGNDVFFITFDRLVAQDTDELADLYDARVGGGFTLPEVPACSGEACKPPNAPAPSIYGAPASAAFVGPGNPFSAPAATVVKPKAKVKKKPKKAKKSKKAKKKAKKSSKRAGKSKHSQSVKRGKR
jgi:hypothetical protein